uniref:hypothetical protein n=1 Tax=Prevotella sp. TaxID=59823 RepID=UPI003FEE4518
EGCANKRYVDKGFCQSPALPSDTIFAFLMLNTPRSAHNKIFGAKFLSFERFETMCLYTVSYVVF